MPINANGEVVGVVIANIYLDTIQTQLEKDTNKNKEDYKILFSHDGTYIAQSSNPDNIGKNIIEMDPSRKEVFDQVHSGKEIIRDGKSASTGRKLKTVYVPVNTNTDKVWTFESAIYYDYFTAGAKNSMIINIIMNIFTIILIGIAIIVIMRRMLTHPLKIVEDALVKMSNYNLDVAEEKERTKAYASNNDEIGGLIRSIDKVLNNIGDIVRSISSHSQNTAATSEELTATAQSTASSANEVASAVNNIAEGATSQAQDTQNAAEAVSKSNLELEKMLKILEKLSKSIDVIKDEKDSGAKVVEELIQATKESSEASSEITKTIIETSESVEKISNASDMIKSIAEQTNLLALNAAIEAAVVM